MKYGKKLIERAKSLGTTLEYEISLAISRSSVREEMQKTIHHNSVMSDEWIIEQCNDFGINYEYEMMQMRGEEQPKKASEEIKREHNKEIDKYFQGKSNLTREDIYNKYKIKINLNFKKNIASKELHRDVRDTQAQLKSNYREIESPTKEESSLSEYNE